MQPAFSSLAAALLVTLAAGCPIGSASRSAPSAPEAPATETPSAIFLPTPPRGRSLLPPEPQHLPAVELACGVTRFRAEVARTLATRQRGLMMRTDLEGQDQGMLFVFPRREPRRFWMQDTPTPLSIAYIRDDGAIVEVLSLEPFDPTEVPSREPVRYALEMARGWFERNGITPGMRVHGLERAGEALD